MYTQKTEPRPGSEQARAAIEQKMMKLQQELLHAWDMATMVKKRQEYFALRDELETYYYD